MNAIIISLSLMTNSVLNFTLPVETIAVVSGLGAVVLFLKGVLSA